ncbi:MAG: DUF429 domain-containing protein [Acidimicrobiales bacterium]
MAAAPPERGDAAAAAPAPVAGLDGCRRGWVLALLDPAGRLCVEVHDRFADAMAAGVGAGSVIIGADIPIGLPADGRRRADVEARRLLGVRRSSVFPTPCRAVLGAADYAEALVQSRAASGKGLSKQAWNLVPKMREVDRWVTPRHEARLHEVHPELAFARLAGGPLAEPKRSPAGAVARRRLLAGRLGRGAGRRWSGWGPGWRPMTCWMRWRWRCPPARSPPARDHPRRRGAGRARSGDADLRLSPPGELLSTPALMIEASRSATLRADSSSS